MAAPTLPISLIPAIAAALPTRVVLFLGGASYETVEGYAYIGEDGFLRHVPSGKYLRRLGDNCELAVQWRALAGFGHTIPAHLKYRGWNLRRIHLGPMNADPLRKHQTLDDHPYLTSPHFEKLDHVVGDCLLANRYFFALFNSISSFYGVHCVGVEFPSFLKNLREICLVDVTIRGMGSPIADLMDMDLALPEDDEALCMEDLPCLERVEISKVSCTAFVFKNLPVLSSVSLALVSARQMIVQGTPKLRGLNFCPDNAYSVLQVVEPIPPFEDLCLSIRTELLIFDFVPKVTAELDFHMRQRRAVYDRSAEWLASIGQPPPHLGPPQ